MDGSQMQMQLRENIQTQMCKHTDRRGRSRPWKCQKYVVQDERDKISVSPATDTGWFSDCNVCTKYIYRGTSPFMLLRVCMLLRTLCRAFAMESLKARQEISAQYLQLYPCIHLRRI
jgi:hypothetical protein